MESAQTLQSQLERLISQWEAIHGEAPDGAWNIMGPMRHGVVEGVVVDLRHADLRPTDWIPFSWFTGNAAGLRFPWSDRYEQGRGLQASNGVVSVREGDVVTIERIEEPVPTAGAHRWTPIADAESRFAWLRVTSPDGLTVTSSGKMRFLGSTRLVDGPWPDAWARFGTKLSAVFGLPPPVGDFLLDDMPSEWPIGAPEKGEVPIDARRALQAHARVSYRLEKLQQGPLALNPKQLNEITDLIGEAAVTGHFLSRYEHNAMIEPALTGVAAQRQRAGAASRSADASRREWGIEGRKLWSENPAMTLTAVMKAVAKPGDHAKSVMRALWQHCPTTSPSYGTCQKSLANERSRQRG